MEAEVAKLAEVPVGTMKRVRAFDRDILLSSVVGAMYATQNNRSHIRASLARGTPDGNVVTRALHGAKFDVTSGRNVGGIRPGLPSVVTEVDVQSLKAYGVEIRGSSACLEDE